MAGYEKIKELKFLLTKKERGKDREIVIQSDHALNNYREDFGKIYDFLENQAYFKNTLTDVSRMLWEKYLLITNQDKSALAAAPVPGNVFTRCLGLVAARYNFNFQQGLTADTNFNTVPIGITLVDGDLFIGTLIRNKLFWKDAISADHGEHSHSLQWLAIAYALTGQTTAPIHDLYAKSVDYWLMSKDSPNINMWQFLVDCFPLTGGARDPDPLLTTSSFRSPQNVTRYLLGKDNKFQPLKQHFLSHYLFKRYKARNWVQIVNPKAKNASLKLSDINPQMQGKADWQKGATNAARYTRTGVTQVTNILQRNTEDVCFHGKSGILYMKEG
ncbi:hypothetical protein E8E95_01780 [Pseudomonas sp. BN414]|uniref:LirA/MavJ family T4SS effector n=1 Tax=Pseudomonas sp. BN414 TaxID=2567888 RepID=UPI0024564A79|nr:LirA/MavJ family T4SS effector [Pseudomonas sp. BN414]MDH4565410.1 hypothetical protein [Pseudomonas sp. BN414]